MKIIRLISAMFKNSLILSKEYILFILAGFVFTIGFNLSISIVSSIQTTLSATIYADYITIVKGSIYFFLAILLLFQFVMIFHAISRRNEIVMFLVHGFGFRTIYLIYLLMYLAYYLAGIILGAFSLFFIIHYMNKLLFYLWFIPQFFVMNGVVFWGVILLSLFTIVLSVWVSIRINFHPSVLIKKIRYDGAGDTK